MAIYEANAHTTGRTPLVRLHSIEGDSGAIILGKIESRNPAGSVKCRVGAALIEDAKARGVLKEGITLIEPTSGNTGVGLAFVAASQSIPLTLVMPENMSIERRKLLAFLGAKLLLTKAEDGMAGSVRLAEQMANEEPDRYLMLQQFKNPANPAIHEKTTGPEIWEDTNGHVDIFVSGVGTGGTISGVSRYFKKVREAKLFSIAVEPEESPVISQSRAGQRPSPAPHNLQGIGAGFIPETLDLSIIDDVQTANYDDALAFARRLAKEEGILSGISGGAAVSVAARIASMPDNRGKTIVVIIPDSAERYLSTELFSI